MAQGECAVAGKCRRVGYNQRATWCRPDRMQRPTRHGQNSSLGSDLCFLVFDFKRRVLIEDAASSEAALRSALTHNS